MANTELSSNMSGSIDENEVSKKLGDHFMLLRNIKENERLRDELDRATFSLHLYDEYKKQKKTGSTKTKKCKKLLNA